MLNYRSFSDLEFCISRNLSKIPADGDLIVGIPRSGLLAASILALHLNRPLTTIDELLEGRILSGGRRTEDEDSRSIVSARKIVIVDDSIASGYEMRRTRTRVEAAGLAGKVIYVAIYAGEESCREVDIYFEICPLPRVFGWNLMHRKVLNDACVDIDGVLCVDPTEEENDDGPRYRRFLTTATPLLRPTHEIGTLVTCRLSRYRAETEAWLQQQGILYRELVMWDLPSKAARLASGGHGQFKGEVYRSRSSSELFIESSASQAQIIAKLAFKPVVCLETQALYGPDTRALIAGAVRNTRNWVPRGIRKLLFRMSRSQ
jgi:uncharacterized HAD superfamily protein/adenine/guanine phosphoribosyltransferase-like PRPP-binding protein